MCCLSSLIALRHPTISLSETLLNLLVLVAFSDFEGQQESGVFVLK